MTKSEINKILKPKKPLLYVALPLLVLSIVMYIIAANVKVSKEDAIDYRKLLFNYDNIKGEYTKLDICSAYSFAGKDNLTYYYVQDADGYVYVARITDETFDKMDEAFSRSSNPDDFTYTIYGYVREVYSDLKKFIISEFDDAFDTDVKLTNSTYDDYFSDTYIDETLAGKVTLSAFFIGAGVVSDIVGLILLLLFLVSSSRSKKSLANFDYDILYSQLASAETVCYKQVGLYLTGQYLIASSGGLRVLKYSDIFWMYPVKNRVNGIPTSASLAAAYSDKKVYTIASTTANKEDLLVEIMQKVYDRNNNILMGYNDVNVQAFRDFQKTR